MSKGKEPDCLILRDSEKEFSGPEKRFFRFKQSEPTRFSRKINAFHITDYISPNWSLKTQMEAQMSEKSINFQTLIADFFVIDAAFFVI